MQLLSSQRSASAGSSGRKKKKIDLFTWYIIESVEKKKEKSESNQSTGYQRMHDCSERNNLSDAQESRLTKPQKGPILSEVSS